MPSPQPQPGPGWMNRGHERWGLGPEGQREHRRLGLKHSPSGSPRVLLLGSRHCCICLSDFPVQLRAHQETRMGCVTSIVPKLTCQRGGLRYKASRDQGPNPGPDTHQLCDLEEV